MYMFKLLYTQRKGGKNPHQSNISICLMPWFEWEFYNSSTLSFNQSWEKSLLFSEYNEFTTNIWSPFSNSTTFYVFVENWLFFVIFSMFWNMLPRICFFPFWVTSIVSKYSILIIYIWLFWFICFNYITIYIYVKIFMTEKNRRKIPALQRKY